MSCGGCVCRSWMSSAGSNILGPWSWSKLLMTIRVSVDVNVSLNLGAYRGLSGYGHHYLG